MAKTVHKNYVDTPVSGVSSLSLGIDVLNFGADFRVKEDEPNEAIITNMTSPIDRPETLRYALSTVADVYKGTGIDVAYRSPSSKGLSLVCQLADIYSLYDETVDDPKEQYLPIQGHIVLKMPCNDAIDAAAIKSFLGRLVAGLFSTGVVDDTRLAALFRGSLLPKDI